MSSIYGISTSTTLGIDPGFSGGLSFISGNFSPVSIVMPIRETAKGKRELDLGKIKLWIKVYKPDLVVVEHVASMPGQGVSSTFAFGRGFGQLEGLLAGMGIRYITVRPAKWMKVMFGKTKKGIKSSVEYCTKTYPEVDWRATARCRKPHDGKTDATMLALYGKTII
jgi:crossover junction endodeoxyribonuclease RuvC